MIHRPIALRPKSAASTASTASTTSTDSSSVLLPYEVLFATSSKGEKTLTNEGKKLARTILNANPRDLQKWRATLSLSDSKIITTIFEISAPKVRSAVSGKVVPGSSFEFFPQPPRPFDPRKGISSTLEWSQTLKRV